MSRSLTQFILDRVPEFQSVVDQQGREYLDEYSTLAVGAFYDFAVQEFDRGDFAVVGRSLAAVENALASGDDEWVDPISIDFIETLSVNPKASHYEYFCGALGPISRKDLETKRD